MEPEVSLPCSQEPATETYTEPDESIPYSPTITILFKIHFSIVPTRFFDKEKDG
jgi:hypothetical protein